MKPHFLVVLFFLFFFQNIIAQDTVIKNTDSSLVKLPNRIYESDHDYRYQYKDKIISQRELNSILINTKDREIIHLVNSSKRANRFSKIGFVAIPLFVIAGLCYKKAITPTYSYAGRPGGGMAAYSTPNPNEKKLTITAGVSALIAISCPFSAFIILDKRDERRSEAIRLYNQKY